MIIYTLVFILVLLAADFCYNRTNRRRRLINKIPGPPALPIIGHLHLGLMPADRVWDVLCSVMEKYGPTAKISAGHITMVSLSDPDDVEILLSSQQHIEKGPSYNNLHPWLKTGLLTSHGEYQETR